MNSLEPLVDRTAVMGGESIGAGLGVKIGLTMLALGGEELVAVVVMAKLRVTRRS